MLSLVWMACISSTCIHYLSADCGNALHVLSYLPQAYLRHFYGYEHKSERRRRAADTDVDADWTTGLCDKVEKMQRFFGLPPSGELTKETLAVMKRPRCGLSDVERFGETIRWKKKTLSYRLEMIRKLCSKSHSDMIPAKKLEAEPQTATMKSIPLSLWGCNRRRSP